LDLVRRQDREVGPQTWIEELHELRTMMSAAALLMRSFGLDEYVDAVAWSDNGPPDAELAPAELLLQADADVQSAMRHFDQAAASLTAARMKLTHLT